MKKITVISGKGGTGKTTLLANLAALASNIVLADCDVDAPNMHLLLNPEQRRESIFKDSKLAVKDENKCTDCGICREVCNFNAISPDFEINPVKCEGCGVCVALCPEEALSLQLQETGKIFFADTEYGPLVHARLKAGAENSGKLVSEVRERAVEIAEKGDKELVLIDGSPGIGCPVIASLNGVDMALIVTEPTRSGFSDLRRVYQVVEHFSIPALLVINKYDLNQDITLEIEEYCQRKKITMLGKIPFAPVVLQALRQGELVVNYAAGSEITSLFKDIWSLTKNELTEE